MKAYLQSFFEAHAYDVQDVRELMDTYDGIQNNAIAKGIFWTIINGYEKSKTYPLMEKMPVLEEIAHAIAGHLYTVELLFVLCLSKTMAGYMRDLNVPEEVIFATCEDFSIKLGECKDMHGVVGTECWEWYTRFFLLEIYSMGRLQFQICQYPYEDYEKNGNVVRKGDMVLNVHIPKTGEPLDKELCLKAFDKGKRFFAEFFGLYDVPFMCSSWLLYPLNREILPATSNIVQFMDFFDIVGQGEYNMVRNPVFAIVFTSKITNDVSTLPQRSSLQRAYAAHLAAGGRFGYGYGVLFL